MSNGKSTEWVSLFNDLKRHAGTIRGKTEVIHERERHEYGSIAMYGNINNGTRG